MLAYRNDLGVPPQFPPRTYERIQNAMDLIKNGNGRQRYEPDKLPYVSVEEAIGDLRCLRCTVACTFRVGACAIATDDLHSWMGLQPFL